MEGTAVDGQRYFHPEENISRAEISAVISRVYALGKQNSQGD